MATEAFMKILENIQSYDIHTFNWCLSLKNRNQMVCAAQWVSKTADGHLYIIIGLALLMQQKYDLLLLMATAFSLERCVYFVLKNSCRRKRPPQALPNYKSVIEPSDQFSFPSGHTSAAFLTATLISVLTSASPAALFCWSGSVGVSRVLLGVHFPTDTIAGAALGMSLAFAVLSLFPYL